MDPMIERMARVLVEYCTEVRKGDWVVVETSVLGEEIAVALQREILRVGGNPQAVLDSTALHVEFLNQADDDQLAFRSPLSEVMWQQADAIITVYAPSNTSAMMSVEPRKVAAERKGREHLSELFTRRTADGSLRWTGAQFPTDAAAQDAQMSLGEYANFVYRACLLDHDDPFEAWSHQVELQQKLIDWLTPRRTVHVRGPGTDLTLGIAGRTWVTEEGKLNFPGGEIFTGPVETETSGSITFTYPALLDGREVTGVHLVFERGRVVDFSADAGEDFLRTVLDMDEGARVLGEFAFGTNYGITKFTRNVLFDEKIGGTLHMALGSSYLETGGRNTSALHWDMVYDLRNGGEVTVDGEPFAKDGQFVILERPPAPLSGRDGDTGGS